MSAQSAVQAENRRPGSYREFWPVYVREHAAPGTRGLHFVGTSLGLLGVALAIGLSQWWLILVALPVAYGLAWIGHFLVEHNRPASFAHPLWSLRGDFQMYWLMLCGRMGREVDRLGRGP